jgi:hypothetical protein
VQQSFFDVKVIGHSDSQPSDDFLAGGIVEVAGDDSDDFVCVRAPVIPHTRKTSLYQEPVVVQLDLKNSDKIRDERL